MKSRNDIICAIPLARWLSVCRWYLWSLCFFCPCLPVSSANGQTRAQLTGTWIGVHTELDADFTCPLPTYMQLSADSVYRLGMVDGSAAPMTSTWAMEGERVRLDTIHFAPRLVTIQEDLLRVGAAFPMVFRRFSSVPMDSVRTYQHLSGQVWQSANLTVSLYSNGRASLNYHATQQHTTHFWRLAVFEQSVFLVLSGSQHTREGGYKPLWQVMDVSPNQFQAIGWNGCAVATETFRRVRSLLPDEPYRATSFQPCSTCFQPLWQTVRLSNTSRRYELNQLLARYYQPVTTRGQSGLLTISFVVNCAGESGLFDVKGVGDDYCPKAFDHLLTSQLLTICRNHLATTAFLHPGKDPADQTRDTAVSLTVRLKDGYITDILP